MVITLGSETIFHNLKTYAAILEPLAMFTETFLSAIKKRLGREYKYRTDFGPAENSI